VPLVKGDLLCYFSILIPLDNFILDLTFLLLLELKQLLLLFFPHFLFLLEIFLLEQFSLLVYLLKLLLLSQLFFIILGFDLVEVFDPLVHFFLCKTPPFLESSLHLSLDLFLLLLLFTPIRQIDLFLDESPLFEGHHTLSHNLIYHLSLLGVCDNA
jgi:hypothetical protein